MDNWITIKHNIIIYQKCKSQENFLYITLILFHVHIFMYIYSCTYIHVHIFMYIKPFLRKHWSTLIILSKIYFDFKTFFQHPFRFFMLPIFTIINISGSSCYQIFTIINISGSSCYQYSPSNSTNGSSGLCDR